MSNFKITGENDSKLPVIAQALKVEKNLVKDFLPIFNEFYESVRYQHLAHLMRAMELYVRKETNNQAFKIVWRQMPANDETTAKIISAVSLKWNNKYGIVTPVKTGNNDDLRKLRVYVAHELGHLFFATYSEKSKDVEEMDSTLHQNMANIFGVFAMLERNEFYLEKAVKMHHTSVDELLKDFEDFVPEDKTVN